MSGYGRMKQAVDHNVIHLQSAEHASHLRLIYGTRDSFVDAQVQVRTATQTRTNAFGTHRRGLLTTSCADCRYPWAQSVG